MALCFRQVFGRPDDGMQKLVQPGEREFGLRLNADRGQDAPAAYPAVLSGALQERGFADAGFTADDQRSAGAVTKPINELIDDPRLSLASDQVGRSIDSS